MNLITGHYFNFKGFKGYKAAICRKRCTFHKYLNKENIQKARLESPPALLVGNIFPSLRKLIQAPKERKPRSPHPRPLAS